MSRVKVLMVGPARAGKTTLANILADRADGASNEYHPTAGCRIVEFDRDAPRNSQRPLDGAKVTVELWDVSGDQRYEKCWPAIQKDVQGIVLVYNPDNAQSEAEIEQWVQMFPKAMSIPPSQCVVFAHHQNSTAPRNAKSRAPRVLQHLNFVETTLDLIDNVRKEFQKFLTSIVMANDERQEHEELSLLGN
eukprot:GILJ01002483.1.p1 GENE.GILJ01002483.1~~GILJ01002483.1.p1  ORF type:complete len:206 (+),score=23.86 GILJ01002483.1:48-620(+)